jgi:hypothetical protein
MKPKRYPEPETAGETELTVGTNLVKGYLK